MFFSFLKEHGTSRTKQMEQEFPFIPGKPSKEEYLLRYSFFPEKISVENSVPFDLPQDQSDFSYKGKAPRKLPDVVGHSTSRLQVCQMAGVSHAARPQRETIIYQNQQT